MSLFILNNELTFPPVQLSEPDGLLAVGGDLSTERLLLAYRQGIFPWYEGQHILWWCPDPRFVLFPPDLRESKSMKQLLKRNVFDFRVDTNFSGVISNCKTISRHGQESTWITDEVKAAYTRLHLAGYAHSAETYDEGQLVGGLYGIRLGKVFFGESMFSTVSNASKYAFIRYVHQLREEGVELIDCQVYTEHLESLGARMIPRNDFISLLNQLIPPAVEERK
ncbi:MAG TPA: leucyl/phenylalanyl-tRNA--protein transferase [Puia sp.]|jgi:leucyl/phenylalanyl-tRNA--protein transferase|nr:leucyl/phenylalanyl-tRNA--protein transferase [Puia sp.]